MRPCRLEGTVSGDQRKVGNRNDAPAGIPPRIAKGIELLQVDVRNAGFFLELTKGGLIEIFVIKDEATGNRVLPDEWEGSSASQEALSARRTEL